MNLPNNSYFNRKQKAADFFKNILKAAAGMATGKTQILEAQEKNRRLAICRNCPGGHFNHELFKCKVCGCKGRFLELKASVNLWQCPHDYWDKLENPDIEAEHGYCKKCKARIVKVNEIGAKTCDNGHITN